MPTRSSNPNHPAGLDERNTLRDLLLAAQIAICAVLASVGLVDCSPLSGGAKGLLVFSEQTADFRAGGCRCVSPDVKDIS
jgi:hypothetical protein